MSREIKFRAWAGTEYLEFSLNPFCGIDPFVNWEQSQKDTDNDNGCVGVSFVEGMGNWIWEQYTGLKDKNGVEIWEGDVIKREWDAPAGHFKQFWEVRFGPFCNDASESWGTGFYFHNLGSNNSQNCMPLTDSIQDSDRDMVVGCIHENSFFT